MEVHVESEGAVSSLHRGDGACVGVGNAWEVENGFGSFAHNERSSSCAKALTTCAARARS